MNEKLQPPRGGDKPPTHMPFLIAPKKNSPPPPRGTDSMSIWAVMLILFFVSLAVLLRVVAELQTRPLPAYMITPILLPSPTSTATRQSTPTLAPTATASPSVTPTTTPTSTPTPLPASPAPAFSPVPATALAMEVVSENPLANWNNNFQNFQLPVLPTPTPLPPVSVPPLDTNWQAYVVAGLVGVNWFLAAVAFLMWRKPSVTPRPLVVDVVEVPARPAPAPLPPPIRVVGRNDARLPVQQIIAVAAPPPPHSPLVIAPLPASPPVTGDERVTGDVTGDDMLITSDGDGDITASPVMSLVTHTLLLPIVPPRPLVGEEIAYCRQLHQNGISKNQLCINFFGAKNRRRMALIQEALDE